MTILFLHGWHSSPGGLKPTYLKVHGHTVLNPALPDDDFDLAVSIAQAVYNRHQPDVVVGSSRGGAVAMNIDSETTPLVLLCPAWKTWGTATKVKPNTTILHSRADETVPFADSEELVANSGLPLSALIEVGTEHRLADEESLKTMLAMASVMAEAQSTGDDAGQHEVGIPRRFAISTPIVILTIYVVLFALLKPLGTSVVVFSAVAMYVTAIGLGQVLLFKGKRPRRASIIVGVCSYPVLMLCIYFLEALDDGMHRVSAAMWSAIIPGVAVGGIVGYIVGLLIASPFLLVSQGWED